MSAPALAVALRLLQTAQDYARDHRHWRTRPLASLSYYESDKLDDRRDDCVDANRSCSEHLRLGPGRGLCPSDVQVFVRCGSLVLTPPGVHDCRYL